MKSRWDKRFWATSRGRIILLLRQGSRTVHELAQAIGLTDNAVRTHLTTLERDGLVWPGGSRPGSRKPIATYELTPEAAQLFPRMYGPLLRSLLDVLAENLPTKKLHTLVQDVGHRMAESHRSAVQAEKLEDRVAEAAMLLGEWGGACEPESGNGKLVIHCIDCPLAVAAAGHPEVCDLIETMLADLLNAPVQQRCQSEPSPQCRFEIDG
jgi:predicted ArsR family transcriptional regulator